MQVLVDKNEQLSRELEECKTQLRATVAKLEESQNASSGNIYLDCTKMYQLATGWYDKFLQKILQITPG